MKGVGWAIAIRMGWRLDGGRDGMEITMRMDRDYSSNGAGWDSGEVGQEQG